MVDEWQKDETLHPVGFSLLVEAANDLFVGLEFLSKKWVYFADYSRRWLWESVEGKLNASLKIAAKKQTRGKFKLFVCSTI
jgi:hypothetical protein